MKISSWRRWWSWARAAESGRPALQGRPERRRLELEQLEDRTLLSSAHLLADINPGAATSNPSQMVVIGSTTYFAANDGTHGNQLWKTDGTAAGTVMVADIDPGSAGSNPTDLTSLNGQLYFVANDGVHGTELWKSDGTAAGTVMVADINPGSGGSYPGYLTNVKGELFFRANDGTHGVQLWKSDGTAAGTVRVSDINPGGDGFSTMSPSFTNVNGELFFAANDGTHGMALWKSDGTAAGTVMVLAVSYPVGYGYYDNFYPGNLTNINGTLFFTDGDGLSDAPQLWKSDGTTAGTVMVKDFGSDADTNDLTDVNGTLYFAAFDPLHGTQLWKSDGTSASTVMVSDIIPSANGLYDFSDLTNVDGELFFAANDGTHGTELWKSDGTSASTVMVSDINPGSAGSDPQYLTNVNGELYFVANDGTHGTELWKSDGDAAGTVLVADINPGSASSLPSSLTTMNGMLLFAANDGVHGNELWQAPFGPSLAFSAASTPTAGVADAFTITALNADGTPDTTLNGAVSITVSDARAVCPASVTLTNGTAQFNVTFKTAGPQSVTATVVQTPTDNGSKNRHRRPAGGRQQIHPHRLPLANRRRHARQLHRYCLRPVRQHRYRLQRDRPFQQQRSQRHPAPQLHAHQRRRPIQRHAGNDRHGRVPHLYRHPRRDPHRHAGRHQGRPVRQHQRPVWRCHRPDVDLHPGGRRRPGGHHLHRYLGRWHLDSDHRHHGDAHVHRQR
jgi:ELWxxDGT repeat protein